MIDERQDHSQGGVHENFSDSKQKQTIIPPLIVRSASVETKSGKMFRNSAIFAERGFMSARDETGHDNFRRSGKAQERRGGFSSAKFDLPSLSDRSTSQTRRSINSREPSQFSCRISPSTSNCPLRSVDYELKRLKAKGNNGIYRAMSSEQLYGSEHYPCSPSRMMHLPHAPIKSFSISTPSHSSSSSSPSVPTTVVHGVKSSQTLLTTSEERQESVPRVPQLPKMSPFIPKIDDTLGGSSGRILSHSWTGTLSNQSSERSHFPFLTECSRIVGSLFADSFTGMYSSNGTLLSDHFGGKRVALGTMVHVKEGEGFFMFQISEEEVDAGQWMAVRLSVESKD
eukprot:gnl/Carplike_NY0171/7927_a10984_171.p1 GENE.gnl/Carplike_NY0171/7927_a10984_171~~gnl/Carplike_NY0171/7927_a10984_171.p1  ORF type:complete len:351 (-),score=55.11 gnl/Carplike_NY0171/7927_a10984_171:325-1347(-)